MAGLNAMDFLGAAKQVGLSLPGPAKYVEILASIQTDYLISGIAPYGELLGFDVIELWGTTSSFISSSCDDDVVLSFFDCEVN